jgi:hypothetical protein
MDYFVLGYVYGINMPMTEVTESTQVEAMAPPKRRTKIRPSDIIIFAVIIVVCVYMVVFIMHKVRLQHEVNSAKVISNAAVHDLAAQNVTALRSLGDKQFQAKNTAASLNSHLTATDQNGTPITFSQLYGKTTPTLDRQIVTNNSRGQHVVFVYKYSRLKAPLFVRIDTYQPTNTSHWYLQALTVGTDETALTSVGY